MERCIIGVDEKSCRVLEKRLDLFSCYEPLPVCSFRIAVLVEPTSLDNLVERYDVIVVCHHDISALLEVLRRSLEYVSLGSRCKIVSCRSTGCECVAPIALSLSRGASSLVENMSSDYMYAVVTLSDYPPSESVFWDHLARTPPPEIAGCVKGDVLHLAIIPREINEEFYRYMYSYHIIQLSDLKDSIILVSFYPINIDCIKWLR